MKNTSDGKFSKVLITVAQAIVISTFVFSSCERENLGWNGKRSVIGVNVSSVRGTETKAGACADGGREVIDSFSIDIHGDEPLSVTAYSSDYEELPFDLSELTKGAVNTSSGLNQSGRSFVLNAWLGSENRYPNDAGNGRTYEQGGSTGRINNEADKDNYRFIKDVDVTFASGKWTPSGEYYWRDDVPTTFWSYYPKTLGNGTRTFTWPGDKASDADQAKVQFSYTLPAATDDKKDAESQEDLLFAYNLDRWTESHSEGVVDIDFFHALSAVRFDISEVDDDVTITQIYIKDIPSGGTCNVSPDDDSKLQFAWTPSTTKTTFRQVLSATDFTEKALDGVTDNALQPLSSSKTFFLIPQTIKGAGVKLGVVFSKSGETFSTEYELNHEIPWVAGKFYTYKLGYDAVDYVLDVEGEVVTNYLASGSKTYSVTSNASWQLQYMASGSSTWTDATAGTVIDGWITFDKVSGEGGTSAQTVTATVTAASGVEGQFETTHDKILREAEPLGTEDAPWDLSMHDIHGTANASGAVTANCYVVSAPGWYAFPLVYGNAISGGSPNTSAYAPTAAAHGVNYLTPFKKADGGGMTSPFIEGANEAYPLWEDVTSYALVPEDGCTVLSQTEAATKGLTGCSCGYVMFEVKADALTQGNAVIAVSNGTDVLWSWHIWVTDEDLSPIMVKNHDETFNGDMLPVNLGWVAGGVATKATGYPEKTLSVRFVQKKGDNVMNIVEKIPIRRQHVSSTEFSYSGYNPYWQWGRKDPFIRANAKGDTVAENTSISGQAIVTNISANNHDIAFSIKNPDNFIQYYQKTEPQVWYKETSGDKICDYYNLWNATNTESGASASAYSSRPVKTVYDPCPPGFQIPQGNAFSGFTKTGANAENNAAEYNVAGSFNNGWNFLTGYGDKTIFFPASGYRNHWSGEISSVGITGNIWSNTPTASSTTPSGENADRVYYLTYHKSNYVRPFDINKNTYGFSVRPVAYIP